MKELGILVEGEVQLGVRKNESRITALPSAPMSQLILPMGKESDNFTAEMLLVALSGSQQNSKEKSSSQWSSIRGAEVLQNYLKKQLGHVADIQIRNGSGLFNANRISPTLIVELLEHMRESSEAPAYLQHLSVGGIDGTLKRRMKKGPLLRRIRAKTGTLAATDALSGYLLDKEYRVAGAFSILISGVKSQHYEARKRMDAFLSACMSELDARN